MRVALDTDRVSLIQGDSLEVLRTFASKSFDTALFDPPYSKHVHDNFGKERRNDGVVVPEALTFPPMTPELIDQVMAEVVRVTRGWILITTDFYNTHLWGLAAQRHGGAWVRSGEWVKTNPKPQMTGDRPGAGSEDILVAHGSPDTLEGRRLWDWNGGGHAATWRGDRDHAWPSRDEGHPNQKPLWLMQSLLGMFCPRPRMICPTCAFTVNVDDLPALPNTVQETSSQAQVLQPAVRQSPRGRNTIDHDRFHDEYEGVSLSAPAGSPGCGEGQVRGRTPCGDGTSPRPLLDGCRGGAPYQRGQNGQPDRELRADGQTGARCTSEGSAKSKLSPLWRADRATWSCPCCRSDLKEQGALVLDPYAGSSTVAAAALATTRFAGESPLETSCKHCRKKLLEAYQPPLPQNVRVIGVEGDQRWIDLSIRRIREAAPSLLAA